MRKKTKIRNIAITILWTAAVYIAVSSFNRLVCGFSITDSSRSDFLEVLGIMYSVIFITTSLLATLSNKDDVVYYENATDYVLINPPVYNFFGLSVMSLIALAAATVSVMTGWTDAFLSSFVMGIGFVIILFFKMTTIYFRRGHIKKILTEEFLRLIEKGDEEGAREKINHLYLNSLKSVDKNNFDICIENLEFLQDASRHALVADHCEEVIKKLLVQISSSDLFYFTRIIELFQSDEGRESFLKIPSMRHYTAELLRDRVVNENDAVTLMSLYSIYVRESVDTIREMAGEALARIDHESKDIRQVVREGTVVCDADPDYYKPLFSELLTDICEEERLLAEVMVLYEPLDTSWVGTMDEICSLPSVIDALWKFEELIDYVDNPFRNELRKYRSFIEEYIRSAVSHGRELRYLGVLKKRQFEESLSGELFRDECILVNDPYPAGDLLQDGNRTINRELNVKDHAHKAVCELIASLSDRQKLRGLLEWLSPCYCDIIEKDGDDDEFMEDDTDPSEAPSAAGRLRDDHIRILTEMMSLRNSAGICAVLRKICSDMSDYNYYFYGIQVLFLDGLKSYNIYSKIKHYSAFCEQADREELMAYISAAKTVFINNVDF
ncbi:MAG: hypothetical protein IKD81_04690 [Eubacteriaceae bacterium]|nr:hypothetical protein [Eubacteriaceae bacterium]